MMLCFLFVLQETAHVGIFYYILVHISRNHDVEKLFHELPKRSDYYFFLNNPPFY